MRRLNIDWGMTLYDEWRENYIVRGLRAREVIDNMIEAPQQVLARSLDFWQTIRKRIVIDIPDDELNAWANWLVATQEYLNFPVGQMCGLDSWGQHYLHISNMYDGWDYLGIHDQQEKWLRIFASSVRRGWIGLYHGIAPWTAPDLRANSGMENQLSHFVNCVYTNWLWTANDQFVRDIWPFARQVMDRELYQNDPDGDGLFAASQSDWAPEMDSFGPKSQLETAQALRALRGSVRMAQVAGDEAAAKRYARYVQKIEQALPKLWDSDAGILGYRDSLDVLKINPTAGEIFFPILRGAVDQMEAYQMLRYAREVLWAEDPVYPGVARIMTSAFNTDRHRTVEGMPDMSWRTAAAAGLAGAADEFLPVIRTFAHAYFFSSWPGGETVGVSRWGAGAAGMNDHNDGRMPALYALGRGLFGLEPDVPAGRITIEPRFPRAWKTAAISQPSVSYRYKETSDAVIMEVSTPQTLAKTLRIPVRRNVVSAMLDGQPVAFHVEPGVNRAFAVVEIPARQGASEVRVALEGEELTVQYPRAVVLGVPFEARVASADQLRLLDPQDALKEKREEAQSLRLQPVRKGERTAFVAATRGKTTVYCPLDLKIVERLEIARPDVDPDSGTLTLELHNNAGLQGRHKVNVRIAGTEQALDVGFEPNRPAHVEAKLSADALASLSPGSNPIAVRAEGITYQHPFINWDLRPATQKEFFDRMTMLDMAWYLVEEANSLFQTKFILEGYWNGREPYSVRIDTDYEYIRYRLENPKLSSPYFLAAGKIPFFVLDQSSLGFQYQPMDGGGPPNMLPVANWQPFVYPSNLTIPMGGRKLSKVYFLAYTWYRAHQANHPNIELIANYADGTSDMRQLIPPFSFRPYYGEESVNQYAYQIEVIPADFILGPVSPPYGVTAGASTPKNTADIYDLPVDPTKPLRSIEVRSVVAESIYAIFAITMLAAP
jgi:hypothetical protein